jgi:hypothetical protein
MPTKTFLPGCKVMFHPLYDGGTTDNYCVKKEYIEDLEKNQAQFIKGLQILLENGIKEKWYNSSDDNLKLLNQIRLSVGMSELTK